jgi:hypothetical protein
MEKLDDAIIDTRNMSDRDLLIYLIANVRNMDKKLNDVCTSSASLMHDVTVLQERYEDLKYIPEKVEKIEKFIEEKSGEYTGITKGANLAWTLGCGIIGMIFGIIGVIGWHYFNL